MIYIPTAVTVKLGSWLVITTWPLSCFEHNAYARLVNDPSATLIFVAVSRVRPCSTNLPDASWTGPRRRRKYVKRRQAGRDESGEPEATTRTAGPVTRSMTRT